ncbi:MAG: AraC family transcriptional regulator [Pseudomonadota bacterium]
MDQLDPRVTACDDHGMTEIWPESFAPKDQGESHRTTLPGEPDQSALQIVTIAPGIVATKSHFCALEGRSDRIRRAAETVLIVIGLDGTTELRCNTSKSTAYVNPSDCWLVHPRASGLQRIVRAASHTSSLVITLKVAELSGTLSRTARDFVSTAPVFTPVALGLTQRASFDDLFSPANSDADLLQAESRCLSVIAKVFSAYFGTKRTALAARAEAYLLTHLSERVALDDLARHLGTNRTRLNAELKRERGTTAFGMLRHLRATAAERLLRETDKTLTQIADETGYSSASHLCKVLRDRGSDAATLTAANDTRAAGDDISG